MNRSHQNEERRRSRVLLSVRSLSVALSVGSGSKLLLKDVSFHLEDGEVFSIVGETGAGKSLLLSVLLGFLPESMKVCSGSIHFCGERIEYSKERIKRLRGEQIAYIPQNPGAALNPLFRLRHLAEDIFRNPNGWNREQREAYYRRVFAGVGLVGEDLLSRYAFQLSGGMQQRFMIGLALLNRPKLILADEPTSALDLPIQAQIVGLLKKIQKERGVSVLFVTHDLPLAAVISDRILVLRSGRVLRVGTPEELFASPADPYVSRLVAAAKERMTAF